MVIAWNSLLQALLERSGTDYYEKDENGKTLEIDGRAKIKGTLELIQMALPESEHHAIRCNLDFFLRLRHPTPTG